MAEATSVVATLTIFGEAVDPDEIAAILGCAPDRSHRVGDSVSSRGTSTHPAGLWSITSERELPKDAPLSEHVASLFPRVVSDAGAWEQLNAAHTCRVIAGWFMVSEIEGLRITPEVMADLAARGLALDFDVYKPGDDSDADADLCRCTDAPPLKVMAQFSTNPIHCMRCNLKVRFEQLGLPDNVGFGARNWASIARAFVALDLDSQEYEVFAFGEQENIESPLNRRGRDVAASVGAACRRTYLWWNRSEGLILQDQIPPCPVCGNRMTDYLDCKFAILTCEDCLIVTDKGDQYVDAE